MRFARGSLGTLLALGFGLAASVVLNRLLGAEGRGAYAVAVKTAGLVVAWAQWGMPEVMLYSFPEHRARQGRLLGTALLVVAISSFVGGAAFFAAYPLLADNLLRGVSPLMFAASVVSSLFAVAFMIQRRVVQLREQLLVFNLLDVAKSAIFLALVVFFVVTLANEREGAVLAFLGAEVLMALAGAAFIWWRVERAWQIDLRLAADLMRSGFVVQVGIVAIFLAGQMGPYIVNLFGTLAEVGYYATALGLATYVTFVSVSVRTVLQARMPALFGRPEALADLTVVVGRHALIWLLAAAAGLAVLARPAITLLYGPEFEPAYLPLVLLLPGMVCYGLQQILASYFTALRLYRTPAIGAWVVALVGLGLQVLAMPLLGVEGAAGALSLGYAAAGAFFLLVFCRSTGRRAREFLPSFEDCRYYLDFGFWILDFGLRRRGARSPIQNPKSKIQNLLLTTSFPPERGGVATLLGSIARALPQEPLVLAPAPPRLPRAQSKIQWVELRHRGLAGRVGYQALWRAHPCLYYLWHFWPVAARLAAARRVEVVQCGHVFMGLVALGLQSQRGTPYVVYAHAQEVRRDRACGLPRLDRALRGAILRHAAAVFALSDYTRDRVLEWGVEPRRVVRLPAGVGAVGRWHAAVGRRESDVYGDGPVLLTVARLVPRKGVDVVLAALPSVLERHPGARYVVVGAGPDEARLRALARRTGLEGKVTFTGAVDDEQLAGYYAACDLFAMPAREAEDGEVEGFGLVFLEAAAYGKPAVAGRCGGMADAVLDGVTGLLVDPTDPQAVAEGLLRLLDDPALLERMGRAARERVERECTWPRAAACVEHVLAGLRTED